jgi:triacylglycerol esterase/lipase EstA (alpha/beta hydrolase family)
MLALLLFCTHIVELALYLGAGALAARLLGWHPAFLILIALGIAAGWRFLLVLAMFAIAWCKRSQGPQKVRLKPAPLIWLVLSEYVAFLLYFFVIQPFDAVLRMMEGGLSAVFRGGRAVLLFSWRTKGDDARVSQACPVLFIHGLLCNAGVWRPAMLHLRSHGYGQLYSINLEPPLGSINRFGHQVAECVAWICAETGASQVILVGHSMGGLAARAALREPGMPSRVAKVITVCSPHHGSWLAHLFPGENLSQMRPGSAWLKAVNAQDAPVPITSIYALHDNLVAPQDSSVLPNAKNIALAGVGHLAIGFSPRLFALLCRELAVTQ